jgi:hypothetical protein
MMTRLVVLMWLHVPDINATEAAESFGKSLFQSARKENEERERNVRSPPVRKKPKKKPVSKNSNEVMLVFPFGADKDKRHKQHCCSRVQWGHRRCYSYVQQLWSLETKMQWHTRQNVQIMMMKRVTMIRSNFLESRNRELTFLWYATKIVIDSSLESFSNDWLFVFWFQWYVLFFSLV